MTVLVCVLAAAGYVGAAHLVPVLRDRPRWPVARTAAWLAGLGCVAAALTGPLATAHGDLRAHMAGHLLLGMVAPLLLVLARPVTLALRTLPLPAARRLSRVLRSAPLRVLGDPFVAVALNAAGLWVLYGTGLLAAMVHSPGLHLLVSVHVLLTGWLATAAVLALDPAPHRRGVPARAVALAAGAAAHDVLAKALYAHPPAGTLRAEEGAQLMYHGGTAVHLLVAAVLWRQWYRSRDAVRSAERAALAAA
ncbi:cytochrome c oxidase assembly protein [Modestobacter sp. VKM Ac-2986]|uniref:cytochrome c oxidase assembly protein n=1 Tax=Modestobacter sp. VKM Ac-2986 TaxID=3004140 RepID=UPI0022AB6D04|nr:cytochrome c oxidase assembly protein [Modestobacter sp. VKM Ac-2986]MCZ2830392.1 cytochrome c oxidase assembly protein [Modestobacter sp. VKM Ac-2986]